MSICASGASQAKPGLADTVIITATVAAASLAPEMLWLDPYIAGAASLLNLHLPDFCTVDPPADPGLSGADLLAIAVFGNANPDPGPMARLNQLILRGLWSLLCQCTSGSTPAISLPATAPTGAPSVNPPGFTTAPTVGNCFAVSATAQPIYQALKHYYQSGTPTTTLSFTPLPQGAAYATVCAQASTPGALPYDTQLTFTFRNAAGSNLAGFPLVDVGPVGNPAAAPASLCQTVAVPAGAVEFNCWSNPQTADSSKTGVWDGQWSISCGGASGQPIQPCCQPDPIAAGVLNNILQMVTLIQRQHVPFATIHGATHAGLSGNGSFAVQGILALAVDVTTLPARAGTAAGDPQSLWEIGWIRTATIDGWGPRHFISADPFVISPIAGDVELVGYSIPADVTVTIVEVLREP